MSSKLAPVDLGTAPPPAPEPRLVTAGEHQVAVEGERVAPQDAPQPRPSPRRQISAWSFFSEADGRFLSRRVTSTSRASVKLNTPAGYRAIAGSFDHLAQRVDLATGNVVDDPEMAHANRVRAATERARDSALQQIAALEQRQARPLRELVREPRNATARLRINEIDVEIARLRAELLP